VSGEQTGGGGSMFGNRARKPHNLAFGVERIGLIPLKYPLISAVIVVVLAIAAAFGIQRIKVDDSLSQLFRSDTPEFKQYETVSHRFPSTEFDVLVVVDGPTLMERSSIEGLRNLVTDLQLVEGTRGIISLFSAREPSVGGQLPAPLFPDELPEDDAEYQALVQRVLNNELIKGKLISETGDLALIVLSLDPTVVEGKGLAEVVGEIRQTMRDDLADTGLRSSLSGVPVMQLEIRNAVERDRIIYNAAGFIAGCVIAILFFRRISFMVVAAGPPLISNHV
jgi:predicted RND superfamily exporter protein